MTDMSTIIIAPYLFVTATCHLFVYIPVCIAVYEHSNIMAVFYFLQYVSVYTSMH